MITHRSRRQEAVHSGESLGAFARVVVTLVQAVSWFKAGVRLAQIHLWVRWKTLINPRKSFAIQRQSIIYMTRIILFAKVQGKYAEYSKHWRVISSEFQTAIQHGSTDFS